MQEVCGKAARSLYEVLGTKLACHLYFDMDRHDSVFDYKVIKQHFCDAFKSFLQTDTDLETATQFSNASRVNKTSLHVKGASLHRALLFMSKITNAFNEWLLQDMNAFDVHPSTINTEDHHYSGHQRTLELSKLQVACDKACDMVTCLCPDATSSDACIDHLIGCYSKEPPNTPM
jgi:hypothetical protein